MNFIKSLAFAVIIFFANYVTAQSVSEKWPAIKDFHGVMSQTFHPSEKGNLAPIKARSLEMVEKAEAIVKSAIPSEFRTAAILGSAERIQIKSKVLHKMILSKATDADITAKLADLHDTFHEIVGLCSNEKH
jgi:hypothetical protein